MRADHTAMKVRQVSSDEMALAEPVIASQAEIIQACNLRVWLEHRYLNRGSVPSEYPVLAAPVMASPREISQAHELRRRLEQRYLNRIE